VSNNGTPQGARLGEFSSGVKRTIAVPDEGEKLFALLIKVLSETPNGVTIVPLIPFLGEIRRQTPKRDADMRIRIPDEVAVNLRGDAARRDVFIFIKIDNEAARAVSGGLVARPLSPLIVPG
jgi:hypothetical protein